MWWACGSSSRNEMLEDRMRSSRYAAVHVTGSLRLHAHWCRAARDYDTGGVSGDGGVMTLLFYFAISVDI